MEKSFSRAAACGVPQENVMEPIEDGAPQAAALQGHGIKPIDGRQVRVGGWIGQRLEMTWRNNLLALDWDGDFLRPFQEKQGKGGEYVGLGKTLDGLVRFAAHTAEPELLALRRHVLESLISAQEADGYLGTYLPEKRITRVWDVHEQAYVLFSLVSDWALFHETRSLDAAKKLGDYLLNRLSGTPLPTEYNEATKADLALELTLLGLDRALLALYRATEDRRYLDFCVETLKLAEWDLPIVEGRHSKIEGHAYAYLTRCLAQLDLQEITGQAGLLSQTRRAVEFLREKRGLVITGTCSQTECWHSDQDGTGHLGETCTTAYWIRLCGRLLCREGSGLYGDLMERAIYNALFAAQSPDGRRLRYYAPFEGKRVYWEQDTYCCPGNFRRIMSELTELIYFTNESGLLVNLYTASQATIKLASGLTVKLVQETDYPSAGKISIGVTPSQPARFDVRLRIPSWCKQYTVKVSGQTVPVFLNNGFLVIEREWHSGDGVELDLEIPWRLVQGMAKQEGRVAVMRGPVLFCLNPTRNDGVGQDLQAIAIKSGVIESPVADETLRPKGAACRLQCDQPTGSVLLTEFFDPDGEATYFKTTNNYTATQDELLNY